MQRPTAGDLNRRVTIRLRQDMPDFSEGITPSRPVVAHAWARIVPVGGAIYYGSTQVDNAVTHRITIRYRADITAEHEIEHGGRCYRVKRVAELGSCRAFTVLDVEELGVIP